jgi:hypothetical protein
MHVYIACGLESVDTPYYPRFIYAFIYSTPLLFLSTAKYRIHASAVCLAAAPPTGDDALDSAVAKVGKLASYYDTYRAPRTIMGLVEVRLDIIHCISIHSMCM